MRDYIMENPRAKNIKRKLFLDLDVKNPSEETMNYLKDTKLPKSGYLNTGTRGKLLTALTLDQLEYIAFNCKQCTDFVKLKSLVAYFIKLYQHLSENDFTEEEYDEMIDEYISPKIERVKDEHAKLNQFRVEREEKKNRWVV